MAPGVSVPIPTLFSDPSTKTITLLLPSYMTVSLKYVVSPAGLFFLFILTAPSLVDLPSLTNSKLPSSTLFIQELSVPDDVPNVT